MLAMSWHGHGAQCGEQPTMVPALLAQLMVGMLVPYITQDQDTDSRTGRGQAGHVVGVVVKWMKRAGWDSVEGEREASKQEDTCSSFGAGALALAGVVP